MKKANENVKNQNQRDWLLIWLKSLCFVKELVPRQPREESWE